MLDIRQLIYRKEKLITKNQCAYFIDFFENMLINLLLKEALSIK
jgi:hypothetical protein